ncbi:MAG: SpoIVB peptidase [Clostridia bacterium]|nr:SpoIVB peptidase [Clostridia bacterium]
MQKKSLKPSFFIIVVVLILAVSYIVTLFVLPGNITLFTGENYTLLFKSPLFLQAYSKSHILKITNSNDKTVTAFERPYTVQALEEGQAQLDLLMFGVIPVKTVQVRSIDSQQVVACGRPIGIKLKTNGIIVINISGVILDDGSRVSPAETAGLLTGDILYKAGGKNLSKIRDLLDVVENSKGNPIAISYKRQNVLYTTSITPIKSGEDQQYRIGIWVRDSSAGIGTLTYIDPSNKVYGALGHGINDIDTGALLQVGSGQLMRSNIEGIKRGLKGSPGELEGEFLDNPKIVGNIEMNTDYGVFGRFDIDPIKEKWGRLVPIGSHSLVHIGRATILACIRDNIVEEYEIEIQRIAKTDLTSTKNMVIRITDKRLLNSTGGIVQGMSGSPILQDGRLIGAVTHVFINDPVRGYGVFIESMIDKSNNLGKTTSALAQAAGND